MMPNIFLLRFLTFLMLPVRIFFDTPWVIFSEKASVTVNTADK